MCGLLAWRLEKIVDGSTSECYDVIVTQHYGVQCDCKGYYRWNLCKHVSAVVKLMAAGRLK